MMKSASLRNLVLLIRAYFSPGECSHQFRLFYAFCAQVRSPYGAGQTDRRTDRQTDNM